MGDAESGNLTLTSDRLKEAGMNVEAKMVEDAVAEALVSK